MIATLFLSAAALTFSITSWLINRRTEAARQRREGERRDDELLAWSHRAIEVMAAIDALARHDPTIWGPGGFDQRRVELGGLASAILDQGRVFFPNVSPVGDEVARATGLRAAILDEIDVACRVADDIAVSTPRRNARRAQELWQARTDFSGYLREIVGDKRKRPGTAAAAGRSVRLAPLSPEKDLP